MACYKQQLSDCIVEHVDGTTYGKWRSWSFQDLAATVGVLVDVLKKRISFWISKGVLSESVGADANSLVFSLVDSMNDNGKTGSMSRSCEELMVGDDDEERAVASVEDQLHKEMTVYEVNPVLIFLSGITSCAKNDSIFFIELNNKS